MNLPGMHGWNWSEEIEQIRREKQKDYNATLANKKVIFIKDSEVYIEDNYFTELAKQAKSRVSVVVSTFPKVDDYRTVSVAGYTQLLKYLPLPSLEEIKVIER